MEPSTPSLDEKEIAKKALEELVTYFHVLKHESDRGKVLIVATYLDEALKGLHHDFIVLCEKREKDLCDKMMRPMGILSSFAAKIQLAYSYGLIDQLLFAQLEILRSVRNYVAHNISAFSFDTPEVEQKVARLRFDELASKVVVVTDGGKYGTREELMNIFGKSGVALVEKEQMNTRSRFVVSGLMIKALISQRSIQLYKKYSLIPSSFA
jgi:DNA-binding MltR family transcriptional regulator